jgi:hypothetical protein
MDELEERKNHLAALLFFLLFAEAEGAEFGSRSATEALAAACALTGISLETFRRRATEKGLAPQPPVATPELSRFTARDFGFTGSVCGSCGGFRMVRTGTCETCQDCTQTSGGCS